MDNMLTETKSKTLKRSEKEKRVGRDSNYSFENSKSSSKFQALLTCEHALVLCNQSKQRILCLSFSIITHESAGKSNLMVKLSTFLTLTQFCFPLILETKHESKKNKKKSKTRKPLFNCMQYHWLRQNL